MIIFRHGCTLLDKLKAFHAEIKEPLYIYRLPLKTTNEELESAIDKSIEAHQNLIPDIIGYIDEDYINFNIDIASLNESYIKLISS